MRFSVGYDLTETVRAAIVEIADCAWVSALDQDGAERANGQVAEITGLLDLAGWPAGSRVLVRRERAHPGAQLSFTDHDGHRFQAILTDQPDHDIAADRAPSPRPRPRRGPHPQRQGHRPAQPAVPRLRAQPRLAGSSSCIAHDLICWTQRLLLTGELARAEPKRLRYRLLHVAARLAFHARGARLRLQASWPWAADLAAAFARLNALPPPA